jgi:hypothetical protein
VERRRRDASVEEDASWATVRSVWNSAIRRVARAMQLVERVGTEHGPETSFPTLVALRHKHEARRGRETRDSSGFDGGGAAKSMLALENMSVLVVHLRHAVHGRMSTNAEQDAIRRDFERTVSDRIREGRAREELLLEERRRQEMRHRDEEDRLTETLSKLQIELRDVQETEGRRKESLATHVARQVADMRASFEEKDGALRTLVQQKATELATTETAHSAEEERLRKLRYRQVLSLTEKLNEYDAAMQRLSARSESLSRDTEDLQAHIDALEAHFALLDENRKLAVAELEAVQVARLEAAKKYHDRYAPATKRIIRWFRGLKKKWADTKKSKPKGKGK